MTIQQAFFAMLSAAGTSAGARVYPLQAPQNPTRPYIVYQRITSSPENVMAGNGQPPINQTRMQVDSYADDYATAAALGDAVQAAMQAWSVQNTQQLEQDLYESDVKLYRVSQDYSIWHY